MLGMVDFIDRDKVRDFLIMSQAKQGGIKKYIFLENGDPIHTAHGLLGYVALGYLSDKFIYKGTLGMVSEKNGFK